MRKFTAEELAGRTITISCSDGVAYNGQIQVAESGESVANVVGIDIHADVRENAVTISATLLLYEDDYEHPTPVDVPVQSVEAQATVEQAGYYEINLAKGGVLEQLQAQQDDKEPEATPGKAASEQ